MGTLGTKVDRRIERSRSLILEALKRLLGRRGADKITISAVSREAGVDRKTVYAHFGSIEGLYEKLAEEIVTRMLDEVERSCGHVASLTEGTEESAQAFFSAIDRAIKADEELDRHIVRNVSEEALVNMLRDILGRALKERRLFPSSIPDALYAYYLQFSVAATVSVYRMWLLSDRSIPIESASLVARQMLVEGISGLA